MGKHVDEERQAVSRPVAPQGPWFYKEERNGKLKQDHYIGSEAALRSLR
jgi:hypothetical protein